MAVELVDGVLGRASLDLGVPLEDPDTGERRGTQYASDDATLERALAAASATWLAGTLPAEERAAALERWADELDARAEEIAFADAVESGVPLAITTLIAGSLGATVRGAVAQLRALGEERSLEAGGRRVELLRLPWGPAVLLTPWNAPAAAAVSKVANALAAGCPAILKPSEYAPTSAGALAEAALAAGLPLQVVHGGAETAARLVADPRVRCVALTGGQAAGRAVAALAAPADGRAAARARRLQRRGRDRVRRRRSDRDRAHRGHDQAQRPVVRGAAPRVRRPLRSTTTWSRRCARSWRTSRSARGVTTSTSARSRTAPTSPASGRRWPGSAGRRGPAARGCT